MIANGNAKTLADQPRQIAFMRMGRHAAHGDLLATMLPTKGQRDIKRGGSGFGIGEEQLIEIAHAEKHQRIRMRGLGDEPLRHGRRGAAGIGNRA